MRSIESVLKILIGQIYEEKTCDDIDFVMWMIVSLTHLSRLFYFSYLIGIHKNNTFLMIHMNRYNKFALSLGIIIR